MNEIIETDEIKGHFKNGIWIEGYKLEIKYDEFPLNPREKYDNITCMWLYMNNYTLGDNDDNKPDNDDFVNFYEMEEYIRENNDIIVLMPVYAYSHGGITISTSPFSCGWDSSTIGFVIITREQAEECFGNEIYDNIGNIKDVYIKRLTKYAITDVNIYNAYINNEVYKYLLYKYLLYNDEGEMVDNRSGFYDIKDIYDCCDLQK